MGDLSADRQAGAVKLILSLPKKLTPKHNEAEAMVGVVVAQRYWREKILFLACG